MRVILAGIFTCGITALTAYLFSEILGGRVPLFISALLIGLVFFIAAIGSCIVFNWFSFSEAGHGPTLEELESQGLITATEFRARRALQVEECEDEGLHYWLELDDGSIFYLTGQYLYDYEPTHDDPEADEERQFPCTDFTVKRHKKSGYIWDVVPHGSPFEPEEVVPPFSGSADLSSIVLENGGVIRDMSFDEVKREILKSAGEA